MTSLSVAGEAALSSLRDFELAGPELAEDVTG
jgi:hypothetical protein